MVKAQHTPGPWQIAIESGVSFLCDANYNQLPDTLANLDLQAAAPDLLAVCAEPMRYSEGATLFQESDFATQLETIVALIRQDKGENNCMARMLEEKAAAIRAAVAKAQVEP